MAFGYNGDNLDPEFEIDGPALVSCREICTDLLKEPNLPIVYRMVLNFYMSECRSNEDAEAYLSEARRAFEALKRSNYGFWHPLVGIFEYAIGRLRDPSKHPIILDEETTTESEETTTEYEDAGHEVGVMQRSRTFS